MTRDSETHEPEPCPATVAVASGITARCELEGGHDGEHRVGFWGYDVVWKDEEEGGRVH